MPWRQTRDPYAIWVSETMLQQTRVETVIPYYHNFMTLFPTIKDLAVAEGAVVLKAWQGLGYYSRARNLHAAARQIVERHAGEFPRNVADFRSLSGVGPYTSGAVFSIAFEQPIPAVDGNVLRVMARFLGIHEPIEKPAVKRQISERVQAWLETSDPNETTQALMELGATVCAPRNAACLVCPLQTDCNAYSTGEVQQLPIRLPKRQRKVVDVHALWCEEDGAVLMQQRPPEGLLASMWQFPNVELASGVEVAMGMDVAKGMEIVEGMESAMGMESTSLAEVGDDTAEFPTAYVRDILKKKLAEIMPMQACSMVAEDKGMDFVPIAREKHIFTHIEWNVTVYRPVGWSLKFTGSPPEAGVPTVRNDIEKLPLPRVYEKLVQQILKG
jgi:A/G-specific adenine glycosylase